MNRNVVPSFIFLLFIAFSSLAAADESVKTLNEEGLTAFGEGRYDDAAELFARAYSVDPQPELLKNRSVALYRAGDCANAVAVAHEFQKLDPSPTELAESEALIQVCHVTIAEKAVEKGDYETAQRYLALVGEDPALDARISAIKNIISKHREEQARLQKEDEVRRQAEQAEKDAEAEQPTLEVQAPPKRVSSAVGWVLVVTGAAVLTSAIAYHIYGKAVVEREFHDVATDATSRTRYDELDAQLRAANWIVPTLYGIAGVSSSIGVGLLVIDSADSNATMTGVAWHGSF